MKKCGYDEREVAVRNAIFKETFFILIFIMLLSSMINELWYEWSSPLISTVVVVFASVNYALVRMSFKKVISGRMDLRMKRAMILMFCIAVYQLIVILFIDKTPLIDEGQLSTTGMLSLMIICEVITVVSYYANRKKEGMAEENE